MEKPKKKREEEQNEKKKNEREKKGAKDRKIERNNKIEKLEIEIEIKRNGETENKREDDCVCNETDCI